MSAYVASGNLRNICAELGISQARLMASRLDLKTAPGESVTKIAETFGRLDAKHGSGTVRTDKKRRDNASAFVTSALSEIIAPVERVSNERYLFVPGRTMGGAAPLLPVRNRVPMGKQQVEWQVLGMTGEARHIGAGGVRSLARVGINDDLKTQPVSLYGVRFGWDQFELWQASHLPGRDVPTEQQRAAKLAMDELLERDASFGLLDEKIPGFFSTGSALTVDLAVSMGDPALTFDQAMQQLSIMHIVWYRANPSRMVSGVVMPESHRVRLLRLFNGANNEGDRPLWAWGKEAFPWLDNIVTDDRLLTASKDQGPMWQMWSADSEELYLEATPTPMLFGPFESELDTDFIMIGSFGGCVNKRYERICRFEMPA